MHGAAGLAGWWPELPPLLVALGLAYLPGAGVLSLVDRSQSAGGPGRTALAFCLALALLSVVAAPLFLLGASLLAIRNAVACSQVVLGCVWAWSARRRSALPSEPDPLTVWGAALVACAMLLPSVLEFAGGTVDDWWDLAFVRSYLKPGPISLADPVLGSGLVHPRFLWNVWLVLEALLLQGRALAPIDLLAGTVAPMVCLATVGAQAFLARAMFPARPGVAVASLLCLSAWLYGTEALPFFTRLHQDKFVAALVIMPVLIGAVRGALDHPGWRRNLVVGLVGVACASVHGLVFCIAVAGSGLVLAAEGVSRWRRMDPVFCGLLGALALPVVYPLTQAVLLRPIFARQGIAFSSPDNPVVRAHLWLGRLLAPGEVWMIVDPSAVFGPVVLVALVGLVLCWTQRAADRGAASVAALSLGAGCAIFVPGIPALLGKLWIPWMLYRIGWLIPGPLLLGVALDRALASSGRVRRLAAVGGFGVFLLVLSVPIGRDSLRRGMMAHPEAREKTPRGVTLSAYDFLGSSAARGTVLAGPRFSMLVPALSGRAVVAIGERGALVFAGEAKAAYARLRDQAKFFAPSTSISERRRIAERYGVEHVVVQGTRPVVGDERHWFQRFDTESLLARERWRVSSGGAPATIAEGGGISRVRELEAADFPEQWKLVFDRGGFTIWETGLAGAAASSTAPRPQPEQVGDWTAGLEPFDDDRGLGRRFDPRDFEGVLAAHGSPPHGRVKLTPPPLVSGATVGAAWGSGPLLWSDGDGEVSITIGMRKVCDVTAVEIVPSFRREMREVLEIETAGVLVRARAYNDLAIRIPIAARAVQEVHVRVRSLLGSGVALRAVRLMGEGASCEGSSRPEVAASLSIEPAPLAQLMKVVSRQRPRARPARALARRLDERDAIGDAVAVLRQALAFDPNAASVWVELGLLEDRIAQDAETVGDMDAGRDGRERARAAFRQAVASDTNSAWARGALAWSLYREGRPLSAWWHARAAISLDDHYADAYTILAYVYRALGAEAWSQAALQHAQDLDPLRNWVYLARAAFAAEDGNTAEALQILDAFLRLAPRDDDVRATRARLEAQFRVGK